MESHLKKTISPLPNFQKAYIRFFPKHSENFWQCTCGRPNKIEIDSCVRCRLEKEYVFNTISEAYLKKDLKEHILRDREEEEAKAAQVKKRKRSETIVLIVILSVTAILTSIFVVRPAIKYAKANRLLMEKDYDRAMNIFSELGNYRDSEIMIEESIYQKATDF